MTMVNGIPSQFIQPQTAQLTDLDMTSLEGRQFEAVYEALTTAINAMQGIQNQPRCEVKGGRLNPAGEYLSTFVEFLHTERTRLIETLNHKKPDNDDDAHRRMHLLVRYEAECSDMKAAELAAFVLSFAKTH